MSGEDELEQRTPEVGAIDDLEALLNEPHDLVRADRLGRIDAATPSSSGRTDLRLDLAGAQVAPMTLGERQQETVHEWQTLVRELEAGGPHVLVDDEEPTFGERAPDLVENVLERLDVVQSLGDEDRVVALRLQLDRVQVADSVGDAVAEARALGFVASDLDRLR